LEIHSHLEKNMTLKNIFYAVCICICTGLIIDKADAQVNLDKQKLALEWDKSIPVMAVRVGRPTNKLAEIKRFYGEGLGLPLIGGFDDHQGFSGALYGMPGAAYHLEFTQEAAGSPGTAPSKDNNLVLYIQDKEKIASLTLRLEKMGYKKVKPINPYWENYGASVIPDPDGWNVILMPAIPAFMIKCCS
jgi:hypothetical protein